MECENTLYREIILFFEFSVLSSRSHEQSENMVANESTPTKLN